MERWVGKVAVITGASSGIGAATAKKLVQEGLIVAGLARRKERIEELAKKLEGAAGKLHAVKVDLTKENEIIEGFDWVKKNLGPIHILVNSAGIMRFTTNLIDGDTQKWKEILDTNVLGLSIATREAVRDMRANNVDGHIIHINSVGGHRVLNVPGVNVYAGSKFAVRALSETLRHEFLQNNLKIKITNLSTLLVNDTEFASAAGLKIDANSPLSKVPSLKAEDVANAIFYVLGTPPHVQIQELTVTPFHSL